MIIDVIIVLYFGVISNSSSFTITMFSVIRMREEKILISRDGPDSNVLKFKPPMVFSTQDADRLVDTLDRMLAELDGQRRPVSNLTLEVN